MKEMTIKIILTDDAGDSIPTGILKDVLDNDCVWNATLDKSQPTTIQYDTQNIKVLNTTTDETVTQTFQKWMMRAMKISETFNTDFEYLKVVK